MRAEAVLSSTPPCQEQAILHHAAHKAVNVPHSLLLELCAHAVIQSLSMDFLFGFVSNLIMNSTSSNPVDPQSLCAHCQTPYFTHLLELSLSNSPAASNITSANSTSSSMPLWNPPVMTRSPKPRTSFIKPPNPQKDPQRSAELPPMPRAYFG
ncbi:hypothetical protein H2248_010120 [Termitomyces sp. 'cryptogamus']|nr:hypothetical protein H2248_010120 [Termitomyces sp. 'cryptogamus']